MSKNRCVLVISDTHAPYSHPDLIPFLKAIKKKYSPDRVIHIGDETDGHAISFHSSDSELYSAGNELKEAIKELKELYTLFPKVDVLESNHGSLVYRRAKSDGIPLHYIKSYAEVLEAPTGWKWHKELIIKLSNGKSCFFTHGLGSNVKQVSQNMGMSVVQGHNHSVFKIDYWANPNDLYFGFHIGCLIDDTSRAYAYNKNTVKRPIIGTGIIIDGLPKLLPMTLNKKGRWTKQIP